VANSLTALVPPRDWRQGLTDPAFFADRMLGVDLHPGQRIWLENSWRPENILVTGNRWGKSFVSAVKLIHHAVYRLRRSEWETCPHYRAVTASITQDQANLVFNQVVRLIRRAPVIEALIDEIVRTPFPKITFGNGATIEARTTQNRGEYLLGNDYDLFVFDEVAFETDPEYVVEEVILMRLADREGRLDLVSTPNGKNWFYQRARDIIEGKRNGYFLSGDSRQNSFVSRRYLDDRVKYFSESRLQQNIMGQFVDSGGEILKGEYVDSALARFNTTPVVAASASPSFISGWDLARKRTATVGITVETANGIARVVALERFRQFDWVTIVEKIKARQRQYPGKLLVDATGLGDVVAEQLAEFHPQSVIFTPAVKAELLTNVELKHARGEVAYPRWELPDGPGKVWSFEDELRDARWDNNSECDSLMALALALWPLYRKDRAVIAPRLGRFRSNLDR
jgi:hypothetical protein